MSQQELEESPRAEGLTYREHGLICPKCKMLHTCLGMSAISETGKGKAARRRHVCQTCGTRFRGRD